MESTLIFALDTPQYHLLKLDGSNLFSGILFDYRSKPIRGIDVYREGVFVGHFPVNLASEDIHRYLQHIPATQNCRFSFDLHIDAQAESYDLKAIYDDDTIGGVIAYRVAEIKKKQSWFDGLAAQLATQPCPSEDLVQKTQGIRDVSAYQNSIIPGIHNMQAYLRNAGVDLRQIRTILDVGCGTGRLLLGWFLDDPARGLWGCDINGALIAWARKHLPQDIQFSQNTLLPPLSYASAKFDLVYLVSVFTHLALDAQKMWIEEIKRVLAPEGILLITLHGKLYVQLLQASRLDEFEQNAYLETVGRNEEEGSNSYGAYHAISFVKALFHSFELLGYFPRGDMEQKVLFPVAAFQDVYVFRKKV